MSTTFYEESTRTATMLLRLGTVSEQSQVGQRATVHNLTTDLNLNPNLNLNPGSGSSCDGDGSHIAGFMFSAWHHRDEMTAAGFRRSMITHLDRFLEIVRTPPDSKEAANLTERFLIVELAGGGNYDMCLSNRWAIRLWTQTEFS